MRRSLACLAVPGLASLLPLAGCFGLQTNISVDTGAFADTAGQGQGDDATPTSVDLNGKLYAIAPESLTLVDPPGLDELFHTALTRSVLMYVADESASAISFDLSLAAADGKQDPCETVRTLPAAEWQNPTFTAGPGDMDVSFGGEPATLRHLTVTGTFDEYAFNWREGTLSAQVDVRELAAALGDVDVCELVANAGGACETCDDGATQCITLRFENVEGAQSVDAYDPTPACN